MDGVSTYDTRNAGGMQRASPPLAPPPSAVNSSCFGTIEHMAEYARTTAGRVERFVDLLCGEAPTGSGDATEPGVFGLLSVAERHAHHVGEGLNRIHAALDRLEKRLP